MGLLILGGKVASAIAENQTAFCALTLHSFYIFGKKLLLCFSLICVGTHADDHVAVPSVFIEYFSFFAFFLSEMLAVTGSKVIV